MKNPITLFILFVCSALALPWASAEVTVISSGKPGQNSKGGRARFEKDVLSKNPDFVLIYYGINDSLNEKAFVSLENYTKNLSWIIDQARSQNAEPVLCTLHPCNEAKLYERHPRSAYPEAGPNAKVQKYSDAVRELARSKGVLLADFELAVQDCPPAMVWLGPDGVHLTPEGYALLAATFYEQIEGLVESGDVVVCFGDSLTYGVKVEGAGTTNGDTYPAQLKVLLNEPDSE